MINKKQLEQISILNNELKDLKKRLERIENKASNLIMDTVQGSSTSYPYIKHNFIIEGVEYPKTKHSRYIYRKQIKDKERKIEKLINELEYELNYIEDKDSEIRQIIRYKYEDNKTWVQIMFLMEYNNEDTARKKLERFLNKY